MSSNIQRAGVNIPTFEIPVNESSRQKRPAAWDLDIENVDRVPETKKAKEAEDPNNAADNIPDDPLMQMFKAIQQLYLDEVSRLAQASQQQETDLTSKKRQPKEHENVDLVDERDAKKKKFVETDEEDPAILTARVRKETVQRFIDIAIESEIERNRLQTAASSNDSSSGSSLRSSSSSLTPLSGDTDLIDWELIE